VEIKMSGEEEKGRELTIEEKDYNTKKFSAGICLGNVLELIGHRVNQLTSSGIPAFSGLEVYAEHRRFIRKCLLRFANRETTYLKEDPAIRRRRRDVADAARAYRSVYVGSLRRYAERYPIEVGGGD